MLRKTIKSMIAVTALSASAVSFAATTFSIGDQVQFSGGPGFDVTGGGAFTLTNKGQNGLGNLGWINTFCLEKGETFNWGTTYKIGGISDAAKNGGGGATTINNVTSDPISADTAFLYTNYVQNQGAFGSLWANASTDVRGTAMQQAIWKLEQEISGVGDGLGNLDDTNKSAVVGLASALLTAASNANWSNTGQVKVLNIVGLDGVTRSQDQLYLAPVPLPAAAWLFGSAILGFVGFSARRRS